MGCPFAGRIKTVAYLYDELIKYRDMDYYPFHMPGHKRRLGGVVEKPRKELLVYMGRRKHTFW